MKCNFLIVKKMFFENEPSWKELENFIISGDDNDPPIASKYSALYILLELYEEKFPPPIILTMCLGGYYFMWENCNLNIHGDGKISFLYKNTIIKEAKWREIGKDCIQIMKSTELIPFKEIIQLFI